MHATTRKERSVKDFVAAWIKVMNIDRYDLTLSSAERELSTRY